MKSNIHNRKYLLERRKELRNNATSAKATLGNTYKEVNWKVGNSEGSTVLKIILLTFIVHLKS